MCNRQYHHGQEVCFSVNSCWLLTTAGPRRQKRQEETGGSSSSSGGERQALCLRQWVNVSMVSCMLMRKTSAFTCEKPDPAVCHAWRHLKEPIWSFKSTAQKLVSGASEGSFPPFYFSSWDVAPYELCHFELAVACCANARLSSEFATSAAVKY